MTNNGKNMTARILQSGHAKSGNFWLYRIIKEARTLAGVETKSWISDQPIFETAKDWKVANREQIGIDTVDITESDVFYRISTYHRERIDNVDSYLAAGNHVWTHSLWEPSQAEFYRKFDKIVYVVRDPRDTSLSKANFAFTDYVKSRNRHAENSPDEYLANRLAGSTITWVRHVARHLQYQHEFRIHFVFFERLLNDTDDELRRLLDYLELDLNDEKFAELKSTITFSSMKERDPEHVSSGQSGTWRTKLTDTQKKLVVRLAGPLLEKLNYPLDQDDQRLPQLPESPITAKFANTAVARSRGTLWDKAALALSLLRSRRPLSQKLSKGFRFLLNRSVQ